MLNNYWEEQSMNFDVKLFHEKQSNKVNLPKWIRDIKCPFCNKELSSRSIRNVSLCLNARNFGEIAIEVLCDECVKMDTLYFRTKIRNVHDFWDFLRGSLSPEEAPILEEKMYASQYNNICEKMILEQVKHGGSQDGTL